MPRLAFLWASGVAAVICSAGCGSEPAGPPSAAPAVLNVPDPTASFPSMQRAPAPAAVAAPEEPGSAIGQSSAAGSLEFAEADGLELFQGPVPMLDAALTVLRASSSARVSIAVADPRTGGATLSEYLQRSSARATASGGYLKSFDPPIPLGLVKNEGQVVNRAESSRLLDGLICVARDRRVSVQPVENASLDQCDQALQSGPVIVRAGKAIEEWGDVETTQIAEERYSRAFFCVDGANRPVLGRTGPVALAPLAAFLRGGHGVECESAVILPHGGGGGLVVPAFRVIRGNPASVFPNAIVIQ